MEVRALRTSVNPFLSSLRLSRLEVIVPHPLGRKVSNKIFVELIEADVEIGFALVDEANSYRISGQPEFSTRVLQDAETILIDIEDRLQRLGESESGPFQPLVAELRNEIAGVERETS